MISFYFIESLCELILVDRNVVKNYRKMNKIVLWYCDSDMIF